MAMKEDWSFLDKISMGAKATVKVTELLGKQGHRIIELERYSSSNKMWSTKIKRLRLADLLCLNCGRRIESRAKSKLGIIMSDSPTNNDRRWDVGLRDEDLVALINCKKSESGEWVAAENVNLFCIGDLRATEPLSKLGPPKSASEGAERDRTWESYVPGFNGKVVGIDNDKIRFIKEDGKRFSKTIQENQHVFVSNEEHIIGGTKIVSSIVNSTAQLCCDARRYDFITDLDSPQNETKYCAVKALGFLPEIREDSIPKLQELLIDDELDERIKLELHSTLIRLGLDVWSYFENYYTSDATQAYLMESVLILGELSDFDKAKEILLSVASNEELHSEIRAAAIWSMGSQPILQREILKFIADNDKVVSTHAIAILEKMANEDITANLIGYFGEDSAVNAAIARIISQLNNLNDREIVRAFVNSDNDMVKNWLLYSIGLSGRERFEGLIDELDTQPEKTKDSVLLLWDNNRNWITREVTDGIEFLKLQN
ncbi:HEAT repeat domain-containing protein [Paenibacillus alvei]|uniref:HEAT repeat domain-containing protein n=1 Tax=Paenibacillus alvei TaxID=44250 RepID=UPI00227E03ED|nr:hypothetical protein [Paenibacillus alvei]MCY7483766.1 hypothetical protein [Paenibacillus alvei]